MTTDVNAADAANDPALSEAESHEPEANPIEDRARRMGWVDEGAYRGPKHKWVDADTYVKRAEEELPVLRSQLRRYDDDNARYEKANADLKAQLTEIQKDFKAFGEHSRKAEERAYERAKSELESAMDKAVSEADEDTYRAAKKRLKELDEVRPAPQQQEQPATEQPTGQPSQLSPAIQTFVNENQWFNNDIGLQGMMIKFNAQVMRDSPHLSESQRLIEAKRRLIERFPEEFPEEHRPAPAAKTNERRNDAPAVASPSGVNGGKKPKKDKTFDDLPDDAKQQYARFASRIPGYSKEEYARSYQWN